jgi:ABC-type oligopeptide transport system substrate-binding subunit
VGATDSARVPAGLSATTETDLQISLAFSYPDWPKVLAHPASAPLPAGKLGSRPLGTGPFLFASPPEQGQLAAFVDCPAGRPFVDTLRLSSADARTASRALSLGEVDAAMGSADKRAAEGPALFATYLALNPARLGADAAAVRQAVESSVDVSDLARYFARGAAPMTGLLATGLEPAVAPAAHPPRPSLPAGLQLTLLIDAGADDQRTVGERLQVKLHDVGAAVQLKRVPHAEYRQALAQGGYDLALVSFAALPEPGLALAQLVLFAQGRDAARELLRVVGSGADSAARHSLLVAQAASLRTRLPLLPLYAQSPRLLVRASVAPVAFDGCGSPALGDAWFIEPRPR